MGLGPQELGFVGAGRSSEDLVSRPSSAPDFFHSASQDSSSHMACSPSTLGISPPQGNNMVLLPPVSLKLVQGGFMEHLESPGLCLVLGMLSGQLGAVRMGQSGLAPGRK